MTRHELDLLLDDVPVHVVPDPAVAWGAGRRRRRRARAAVVGGTTAVLVLLAAVLGLVPRVTDVQPADGRAGVEEYPQRIDESYWVRDLPDDPGPLAGALLVEDDHWLAVSPTGRLWRLPLQPGQMAAISPDGTRLAYGADDRLVVHDLVSGEVVAYDDVRAAGSGGGEVRATADAPLFFSADGDRVLVPVESSAGAAHVVLERAGSVTEVPAFRASVGATAAGWIGDDLGFVVSYGAVAVLEVVAPDGTNVRAVTLPGPDDLASASLSPDGARLAITSETEKGGAVTFLHDATTGERIESGGSDDALPGCPVSWRGGGPLQPGTSFPGVTTAFRRPPSAALVDPARSSAGRVVVAADPRLGYTCSLWASDALSGEPHRGVAGRLFGTNDLVVWWYWRETLAVVVVLGAAVALVVRRRRYAVVHSSRSTP